MNNAAGENENFNTDQITSPESNSSLLCYLLTDYEFQIWIVYVFRVW